MTRLKPSSLAALAAVIAALAVAFSVGASAVRRPAPPNPVIAVIDFPAVLDGLAEAAERQQEHKARFDRLQADLDALSNELKDASSRLDAAPPEERIALAETVALLQSRLNGQARASDEILKIQESKILADLYAKIITATGELAEQAGYTMVLSSDTSNPMPNFEAVHQAAKLRRIVYAAEGHDITQELIDFMNNRRAAGQ